MADTIAPTDTIEDHYIHVNIANMGWVRVLVPAEKWAEGGFVVAARRVVRDGVLMRSTGGTGHMLIPGGQIASIMENPPSAIAVAQDFKVVPPGSTGG